jgi:hypothetical protein
MAAFNEPLSVTTRFSSIAGSTIETDGRQSTETYLSQ